MGGEKKKKKERRGERRKGSYVGFICVSVCEMARRQASIFFKCALKKKKPARVPGFFLYCPQGGLQGTPEGGLAQGTLRAPCPKCGSGPRVPSGRVVGYPRERSGPGYPKTAFDPNAGWVPGYLRGVFIAKKLGGAPSVRAQAHAELALSPAFFLLLKKRGVLDFQAALICSTSHAPGRK